MAPRGEATAPSLVKGGGGERLGCSATQLVLQTRRGSTVRGWQCKAATMSLLLRLCGASATLS